MTEPFHPFLQRCISVDLEVNPASAKVFALAAVHADGRPAIVVRKPPIELALDRLDGCIQRTRQPAYPARFNWTCVAE